MDPRPDLYSELYREMVRERTVERWMPVERRRQARHAAGNRALRARLARVLFRAATAVDSREVWRVLWEQLTRSDHVESNGG
jgi:hypothetical protein